jgi:hypothetical protein
MQICMNQTQGCCSPQQTTGTEATFEVMVTLPMHVISNSKPVPFWLGGLSGNSETYILKHLC